MDCLAVETPSSYDHISSFLEDFQDKNSHLFPSSDLSFDMLGPVCDSKFSTPSCGSKRPREASYDSFSSWVCLFLFLFFFLNYGFTNFLYFLDKPPF